jgi:hypothetical protein
VQNFMNTCVSSAVSAGSTSVAAQRVCGCTLDKIQQRYSLSQFSRMEVDMAASGTVPGDVLQILADCRITAR